MFSWGLNLVPHLSHDLSPFVYRGFLCMCVLFYIGSQANLARAGLELQSACFHVLSR
jgi:hypothetical protein